MSINFSMYVFAGLYVQGCVFLVFLFSCMAIDGNDLDTL